MHRPSLLVLDEPVNGLDPAGVVEIRILLLDLAREHGVTVLLSSHLLSEVARIATRIGVLHHGRLIDEFPTGALAARVAPRLEVGARETAHAADPLSPLDADRCSGGYPLSGQVPIGS
jgi:ABC-2 type transport system ATP-binding protein